LETPSLSVFLLGHQFVAEYTRPYLYPQQLEAIFCPERYSIIEASTKSGKTVGCIAWIVEQGLKGAKGHNFWWVAPGYNQAEIAYRRIKLALTSSAFVAYDTPTPRLLLLNGAWIWFKSADNSDALYGEDVYAAVVDEASRIGENSWHAVRSTLTATRGPVRIIGNVKGRKNWFYDLARKAEVEMLEQPNPLLRRMHYAKITADDAVNAGVLQAEEIEDARSTLPENIFRELYFAEPGDDTGNPFGIEHIKACTVDALAPGPVVAWGIDLAKSRDWFVCIGLNELGQVAEYHRWRGLPWKQSIFRVWKLVGEDTPALVDSTGVGDPVLEAMQEDHQNFIGYKFSNSSKQKLMEGLAVAIQSREVQFPKGQITRELEAFEYVYKPSGVQYAAPEGADSHDDCVCALALARQMWTEQGPGQNIMKFYAQTNARLKERENETQAKPPGPWEPKEESVEGFQVSVGSLFDNELEELYETTVRSTLPERSLKCAGCGELVLDITKVSDGEYVWHGQCARMGVRQKLKAETV
jgi:hypothetical protein